MIKKYLKSAWRALIKRPGITLIKIFGLSIGLTGTILIMLWVQNETSYDSYHNNSDKIYRVTWDWVSRSKNFEYSPFLLADAARREIPEVDQTARLLTTSLATSTIEIDGNEASSIKKIESVYKQLHPKYLFTFTFLDEAYQQLYSSEQRAGKLSKYFAGLAIIISCLGLFGLAAFAAQRRQKEIGIRKIVGASVSNIVLMLSGNLLKLVSVSIVIALPVASWAMNKWLENFAYKTTVSAWIFVIAGAMALGIALLTVSFQSVRAAVTNPVRSLRNE